MEVDQLTPKEERTWLKRVQDLYTSAAEIYRQASEEDRRYRAYAQERYGVTAQEHT